MATIAIRVSAVQEPPDILSLAPLLEPVPPAATSRAGQQLANSAACLKTYVPQSFLSLPYEIRHYVYTMLFRSVTAFLDVENANSESTRRQGVERARVVSVSRSSQLLRVCKAIDAEALPILWGNTRFYLHPGTPMRQLENLAHTDLVKNVIVRIKAVGSQASQAEMLQLKAGLFRDLKVIEIKASGLQDFWYFDDFVKEPAATIKAALSILSLHPALQKIVLMHTTANELTIKLLATDEQTLPGVSPPRDYRLPPFLTADRITSTSLILEYSLRHSADG